ncbi:MAG: helix-turn-helix domain-containing protein [Erythrobacter sp.]
MALKAHLDTTRYAHDDRRHPRHALRLETSGLMPNDVETNVTVHNISAAGLLIETHERLAVGDVLAIDLPEIGPVGAEIVWQSEQLFGCAFEQALGEAALAAAQLRGGAPYPGGVEIGAPSGPSSQQIGRAVGDSLGAKLNRLRRERSLTLAQVAGALDVSKPTVWAWEKGKARPLPERIGAIAKVLGVSEEELNEGAAAGPGAELAEECRRQLATAYGVDVQAIRIMIEV